MPKKNHLSAHRGPAAITLRWRARLLQSGMTNTVAIWLGVLIVGFFLLDQFVLDLGAGLFLAKRGLDLIEYLAFWR
jgi:hypothetical protein